MTSLDLDFTVLEQLDSELEIPCDYGDWNVHSHGPARWVGFAKCPACGHHDQRLICKSCKDLVIATEHGCYCGSCEERIVPFRRVFTRFEPLKKA